MVRATAERRINLKLKTMVNLFISEVRFSLRRHLAAKTVSGILWKDETRERSEDG